MAEVPREFESCVEPRPMPWLSQVTKSGAKKALKDAKKFTNKKKDPAALAKLEEGETAMKAKDFAKAKVCGLVHWGSCADISECRRVSRKLQSLPNRPLSTKFRKRPSRKHPKRSVLRFAAVSH